MAVVCQPCVHVAGKLPVLEVRYPLCRGLAVAVVCQLPFDVCGWRYSVCVCMASPDWKDRASCVCPLPVFSYLAVSRDLSFLLFLLVVASPLVW